MPKIAAKRSLDLEDRAARARADRFLPEPPLNEGRDDIDSLPLPRAAKAYARRKGLRAMKRQPWDCMHVTAMLSNPGKTEKGFTDYDQGVQLGSPA